jgi:hypothetical protein
MQDRGVDAQLKRLRKQTMRTTLATDEHVSLGAVVSELMHVDTRSLQIPTAQHPTLRSKYAVLPTRDETITREHVDKLMDQEGI